LQLGDTALQFRVLRAQAGHLATRNRGFRREFREESPKLLHPVLQVSEALWFALVGSDPAEDLLPVENEAPGFETGLDWLLTGIAAEVEAGSD
jgi:hypothetical protein